jgi:hypothetical protein
MLQFKEPDAFTWLFEGKLEDLRSRLVSKYARKPIIPVEYFGERPASWFVNMFLELAGKNEKQLSDELQNSEIPNLRDEDRSARRPALECFRRLKKENKSYEELVRLASGLA